MSNVPALSDLTLGKRIPKTNFVVDAFKYKNPEFTYFLSHFHQDHWGGITKNWNYGPIHCSDVTGRLLVHVLDLPREYIITHPLNVRVDLQNGHSVQFMDANHCPGAVVLIFDVATGETDSSDSAQSQTLRYVHCGDFRYCESMKDWAGWKSSDGTLHPVQEIMLDTTYCHPKHIFPKQIDVVDSVGSLHRTLFIVATYTIGKEKLLSSISEKASHSPIYVNAEKREILRLLDLADIDIYIPDPKQSCVHDSMLLDTGLITNCRPQNSLYDEPEQHYSRVTCIVPTGWTWEFQKRNREKKGSQAKEDQWVVSMDRPGFPEMKVWQVPYSEHSNFAELREFVSFLRPVRVVPTVVGSSQKVETLIGRFRDLVDTRKRHQGALRDLFGSQSKLFCFFLIFGTHEGIQPPTEKMAPIRLRSSLWRNCHQVRSNSHRTKTGPRHLLFVQFAQK
ncbi:beta-lactamase-like protein [Phlyctochytrium arcticum]|nr:beta-lactamase-like protein [Phlyctochytrium arcticum]